MKPFIDPFQYVLTLVKLSLVEEGKGANSKRMNGMEHFLPTRPHSQERYTWTKIYTLGRIVKGGLLTAEGRHEACPPKKCAYWGTEQIDQDVCVGKNCQRY